MAKPVGKLSEQRLQQALWGNEPYATGGVISSQIELIKVLNWYNYSATVDQCRQWLIDFARSKFPSKVNTIETTSDSYINRTMAALARLYTRNVRLPDQSAKRLVIYFKQMKVVEVDYQPITKERDRLVEFLPVLEKVIDDNDTEFDCYNWLVTNSVPQFYARQIANKYWALAQELIIAASGTDPDLNEGYQTKSKIELLITAKIVVQIIDDCDRYLGNVRKVRKPRKVKEKSVGEKLKFFKYCERFDKLKLQSINPQNIFGASIVFTLNTTNNIVTMYSGKEGGLSVHRTAITNYVPQNTISKRAGRHLNSVIDVIVNGSKKQRNSVLDQLNSERTKVVDRININTILLRADR